MRTFKTKPFARFADREGIEDAELCEAARRVARRLVDADLGGGVIKQRIARPGQGKSGGVRAIVLFRHREFVFFVYGFAKSRRENLRPDEIRGFRSLANEMVGLDERGLDAVLAHGTVSEVNCDG